MAAVLHRIEADLAELLPGGDPGWLVLAEVALVYGARDRLASECILDLIDAARLALGLEPPPGLPSSP